MPSVLIGPRSATRADDLGLTTLAILSASVVVNMDNDIFLLDGSKAPLALLASKISSKSVHRNRFDWLEDDRIPSYVTMQTAAASGALTLGFNSGEGDYFPLETTVDDGKTVLLRSQRTGEVLRVTARSTSTVVTASRSWGATAAAALVVGDVMTMVGTSWGPGITSGRAMSTLKVEKQNYLQIYRSALEFTNSELATLLYGPSDLKYQQKKRGVEHAIDIEQSMWWGESSSGNTSASAQASGGLDEVISTNAYNFGGSFNLVNLFSAAEDVFRYKDVGSDVKLLFAAPAVVSNISLEASGLVKTVRSEQTFGVKISRLETPHGDFMVIKHNLFAGGEYAKYAYIVDPRNIGWRYLRGRNTKFLSDIQENDKDGRKFEYLTEGGFMRKGEQTHARIKNAA